MRLELPYPPSVNHYWHRSRTGGMFISKKGREFRSNVEAEFVANKLPRLDGPLEMRIALYPPDRRRRDIDNVMKSVMDSLQHAGAYHDDNQIHKLTIQRCEVIEGGATLVDISAFDTQSAGATT